VKKASGSTNHGCTAVCHAIDPLARCEGGHELTLLNRGDDYVPAMLEAMEMSRASIALELYRVDPGALWDRFSAALIRAAARGVRVRLYADSFGSRRMREGNWSAVRRAGVEPRLTPTVLRSLLQTGNSRRDHRKLLIVDDVLAFTGGMSVDDTFLNPRNEPTWRETMVAVRGPLVAHARRAFEQSWKGENGDGCSDAVRGVSRAASPSRARLILSSPGIPRGESLFGNAIAAAKKRVWITNPFVVPTETIDLAMRRAALRGVDIRLLVPGTLHRFPWVRDAMRGYYQGYFEAGVRVYEYSSSMLHAKTISIDDEWAAVGSFNLDARSLLFNDELAVAACDVRFAAAVADAFEKDCVNAVEIDKETWATRPLLTKCRERIAARSRRYL